MRGFDVLTNLNNTAVDANDRPLADEIIQKAIYVPDTADTVLTLTATNVPGVVGTITVIADDGTVGGRATNVFTATLVTDASDNSQSFIYPNTTTNLVGPVNTTLTNFISAIELGGDELYWFPYPATQADLNAAPNSSYNESNNIYKTLTYNVTNTGGQLQFFLVPIQNYVGPVTVYFYVSYDANFPSDAQEYSFFGLAPPNYDLQVYKFVFGDTPISGQSNNVIALAPGSLTNVILATFTNGVPGSASGNFTASINWGDDVINSGVVTANPAGKKAVLGSHAYSYPGTYPVYVQVQSAIGANNAFLSFVTVTNQATPATSVLTVQVTGQGTVLPNDNNASLAVGGAYSLNAIPAANCVLVSWTDGNGFVLGNSTNISFTMYPGLSLTANFQVVTNPVLKVVSPLSGQVVTNLYSTPATVITGTASNNAVVTNVWYQINTGGWQTASGTTNWSVTFIPAYGVTNVFQAYAVNNFGDVSTTNTVLIKYLAGDVLTVKTNGLGSITPNLNGALLPLGTNYVLTAAPASGFAFTGWTGSLTTNGAALKFTMATNLTFTANFADTNKPVVSITNLAAGQRVSNAVFTVKGTAGDNWQVSNVLCQINGGGWNSATNLYHYWTNWAAGVTLTPGTNLVQAFAVDTTGNVSTTNSVSFQFVVTNQLQIQAVGLGTISPNYSNAWLEIGRNYSITSTPASGFVFSNWVTSTNWIGGVTTTKTNLPFMMASNLTLQVTFLDVTKPTLSITAPTAGQHMTNALATVVGTTADNWKVGAVWYQLTNGILTNGTWSLVTGTTNSYTNWTTIVTLAAGSNTVKAYAVDLGGNHSSTSSVSVLSSNTFKLKLNFALSQPLTSTGLNFTLQLSSNLNGHILVSTNLTSWAALTNFVGTNTTLNFRDPAATNSQSRFYRAVIP